MQAAALFSLLAFPMRVFGFFLQELPRGVVASARLQRVVVNQLKYSTQNIDTPWPWSGLSDTIIGFAARFAANVKEYGIRHATAVGRHRFVTNRPISPNVLEAIDG